MNDDPNLEVVTEHSSFICRLTSGKGGGMEGEGEGRGGERSKESRIQKRGDLYSWRGFFFGATEVGAAATGAHRQ